MLFRSIHTWISQFSPEKNYEITITLLNEATLSMIRIWNYNKSRVHSFKGIKDIKIKLDETDIFTGEIKRASGDLVNPMDCCEVIMFTNDDSIIESISDHDWINDYNSKEEHAETIPNDVAIINQSIKDDKNPEYVVD